MTPLRNLDNMRATPWTRHQRRDYEDVLTPGAQVEDASTGVVYRLTLGSGPGGTWITHLQIDPTRAGDRINRAFLATVPVSDLIAAAQTVLKPAPEPEPEKPARTPPPVRGDAEGLARVAAAFPHHNRAELAALFGLSMATLDRRVAQARKAGLLPPAKTGRPRAQLPGGPPLLPPEPPTEGTP